MDDQPPPPCTPHRGTVRGYDRHRRTRTPACQPCKDAQAAWQRAYEKRRYLARGPMLIDSTGTTRRLQALAAIGWPSRTLGEALGVSASPVRDLTRGTRPHVTRQTAAAVAALYDRWAMTRGPSARSAQRAAAKGWAPPLAYDDDRIDDPKYRPSAMIAGRTAVDEVAVDRAAGGDRTVRLRRAERTEVVRRLTAAGMSAEQIAARMGTTARSVQRRRAAA